MLINHNPLTPQNAFIQQVRRREDPNKVVKLLKRTPLPTTTTWNGKGETLEDFISGLEGHVDQQQHMSYLLIPELALLWLKFGNHQVVINIARKKKLHHSVDHIEEHQLANDISWLYGALKQSLKKRGKAIVRHYQKSRDGLAVWKQFLDTFRYGGDVDVYIIRQQDVLRTQYTPNYPGKELGFLEDYETAFVNIEAVSPDPLYSDEGKRQTFLANFSLINHTAEIADILSSQTSTWEELTSSL